MKQLIEDYKRKLANLNQFLEGCKNMEGVTIVRLEHYKAECYKEFITKLEAIEREVKP